MHLLASDLGWRRLQKQSWHSAPMILHFPLHYPLRYEAGTGMIVCLQFPLRRHVWAGHWRMDTSETSEMSDLHASSSLFNLSPSQRFCNPSTCLMSWGVFLSFKLNDKHLLLTSLDSKSSHWVMTILERQPFPLSAKWDQKSKTVEQQQRRGAASTGKHSRLKAKSCCASHKPPTCTLAKLFVIKPSKTRRTIRLPDWGNLCLCKFQIRRACACKVLNAFIFRISLPL